MITKCLSTLITRQKELRLGVSQIKQYETVFTF